MTRQATIGEELLYASLRVGDSDRNGQEENETSHIQSISYKPESRIKKLIAGRLHFGSCEIAYDGILLD